MNVLNQLKIKRDERVFVLFALAFFLTMNIVFICSHYYALTPLSDNYKALFIKEFHISGFDPLTYAVLSDWDSYYNEFRHPLLAYYMYVPYLINKGLMWLTGINCAMFIMVIIQITNAVYGFVFLKRIMQNIIGIERRDAVLLSFLNYSFAYAILSSIVPDHFGLSMTLLIITLYVAGMRIKGGRNFGKINTIILFLLTAGVSLNNGIKVFLANLFTDKLRFFKPQNIVLVLVLSASIWYAGVLGYQKFTLPKEIARKELKKKKAIEQKKKAAEQKKIAFANYKDTVKEADSVKIIQGFNALMKQKATQNNTKSKKPVWQQNTGKPISNSQFMIWTDISTPRMSTAIENVFGESILLHSNYLLKDVLVDRPVIVKYTSYWQYIAIGLFVLLFFLGIVCGIKSRFLWLSLSFLSFDLFIHFVLGFGINEIYIMSAHWLFVFPIAIAYAFKNLKLQILPILRIAIFALTTLLLIYNSALIISYLV